MKRALPLVPDEAEALLWAPWRMLESDHDSFGVELRELEGLLEQAGSEKRCPARLLSRMDRFIAHFESHMGSHFQAEEKAVFPYLRRHSPRLTGALRRLAAEHKAIRRTLAAWKRSFKKTKAGASPRAVRDARSVPGLKLVRLLSAHVEKENRLMRRYPSKAVQ